MRKGSNLQFEQFLQNMNKALYSNVKLHFTMHLVDVSMLGSK